MVRVLHILPALDIGGVEIGVKSSRPHLLESYDYRIFSIKGPGNTGVPTLTWPALLHDMLSGHKKPDVVVSSLWPSHPLGWAFQALGIRWIPFFHAASREGGACDQILTWAAKRSRIRLCDSPATARYFGLSGPNTIICPYIFLSAKKVDLHSQNRPFSIVVCGRLSPEKRPDLILSFLEIMQARWPNARSLLLLSSDSLTFASFEACAKARQLAATILQNVPSEAVADYMRSAEFYLNLSDYEGFSMTTVEAIQSGCIPVVRPVGEIPNYLPRDAGVYIDCPETQAFATAIDRCKKLSAEPARRAAMAAEAGDGLARYEDYVTAFTRAINHAMDVL